MANDHDSSKPSHWLETLSPDGWVKLVQPFVIIVGVLWKEELLEKNNI